jgi:hypothetical protein
MTAVVKLNRPGGKLGSIISRVHFRNSIVNESQRAKYRGLVDKEFEAMNEAVKLWERQDITRQERMRLFSEAQTRIDQLGQDSKRYAESIAGPIRAPHENAPPAN